LGAFAGGRAFEESLFEVQRDIEPSKLRNRFGPAPEQVSGVGIGNRV
jgi:hypothetical protein